MNLSNHFLHSIQILNLEKNDKNSKWDIHFWQQQPSSRGGVGDEIFLSKRGGDNESISRPIFRLLCPHI